MSYAQLTSEERYVIYHLKLFKLSLREIARRLNRLTPRLAARFSATGRRGPNGSTGMKMPIGVRSSAEDGPVTTAGMTMSHC